MDYADVPAVHALAGQCNATPWQTRSFEYELASNDAILQVAVLDGAVAGYVCLRNILDITHVMDVGVRPDVRRSGVGTMLMLKAMQELRKSFLKADLVTLEVRESNIAAIGMYEKIGFKEIGRRKGYYKKPVEDALIMELDLTAAESSDTYH